LVETAVENEKRRLDFWKLFGGGLASAKGYCGGDEVFGDFVRRELCLHRRAVIIVTVASSDPVEGIRGEGEAAVTPLAE